MGSDSGPAAPTSSTWLTGQVTGVAGSRATWRPVISTAGKWPSTELACPGDLAARRRQRSAESGSAYLYDLTTRIRSSRKLVPDQRLQPVSNSAFSASLDGSLALVGAPFDDVNGNWSGSAYLFDTETGQQIDKIVPADGGPDHRYGHEVCMRGTRLLVGSYHDDDQGTYLRFRLRLRRLPLEPHTSRRLPSVAIGRRPADLRHLRRRLPASASASPSWP